MKQYFSYFKLQFITTLQYRMAAVAGMCTQVFFGLVFIMIYLAFYESNNTNVPMQLQELINYLWLNQCFLSLMYLYYKDKELLDMIKNGNIAYELCRPQNLYIKWYLKTISIKVARCMLRILPVIVIALLLPKPLNLTLPANGESFILFVISLIIGTLLVSALALLYHVITIFTIDEKGTLSILMVVADLFSGGVVPIPFLPKVLKLISNYLPFQYIFDLPYRIYSGNFNMNVALINISIQFIWLIIIIFIGYLLTQKAIKKVIVQGG